MSVVNALSEHLDLHIWRNGKEYFMRFRHGEPEEDLELVGDAPAGKRGTEVTFLPSTGPSPRPSSTSTSWRSGCASWRS